MDYFHNVFTFLGLERVSCDAVYTGSESSQTSSNIYICVPKMNEGLTGSELQEGRAGQYGQKFISIFCLICGIYLCILYLD